MKYKAFTLFELMIVVAVLVITAAIVLPAFQQYQCKYNVNYREQHPKQCSKIIEKLDKQDKQEIKENKPPPEENTPTPILKPRPENPLNDNKIGYVPRDITQVIKQEMQIEMTDACELEGQYVFTVSKTEYTVKCNKPSKKRIL